MASFPMPLAGRPPRPRSSFRCCIVLWYTAPLTCSLSLTVGPTQRRPNFFTELNQRMIMQGAAHSRGLSASCTASMTMEYVHCQWQQRSNGGGTVQQHPLAASTLADNPAEQCSRRHSLLNSTFETFCHYHSLLDPINAGNSK